MGCLPGMVRNSTCPRTDFNLGGPSSFTSDLFSAVKEEAING